MTTRPKPVVAPLTTPTPAQASSSLLSAYMNPSIFATDEPTAACQICFDVPCDAPSLTSICGPACPAIVCGVCFETHVRISLASTLPGILPRLRCPVCLVQLPKEAWHARVQSADLVYQFESLCELTCAFIAPCCHNDQYTQLPELDYSVAPPPEFESFVDAQLQDQIPILQQQLLAFIQYEITARALVRWIDTLVEPLGYTPLSYQEFIDMIALRIDDDERRAALIVAFHTLHKCATTRCCLTPVCFLCKREWNSDHEESPHGLCDKFDLTENYMVECRSCHVTIVKVQGCNGVRCPCGFQMSWSDELRYRSEYRDGLIPTYVDIYDLEGFTEWNRWRDRVQTMVKYDIPTLRIAWRTRDLDRGIRRHRPLLRRMLQTYLWRRRFRIALPDLVQEMHVVRRGFLIDRLRRCGFFHSTMLVRIIIHVRFRQCMRCIERQVITYDEEVMDSGEAELTLGLFDW